MSCKHGKTGFCRLCHVAKLQDRRRRWTDRHTELLKEGYQAGTRDELTKRLNRLAEVSGFDRGYLLTQARRKGFATLRPNQRPFTAEEDAKLEKWSGEVQTSTMATYLGRSESSVRCRLYKLGLSGSVKDGYTAEEFADALGVSAHLVRKWEERGILTRRAGRIGEFEAARFVCNHYNEYDLRRVDQLWFKDVAFSRTKRPYSQPTEVHA